MEDDRTWKEKVMDSVYELLFDWECSPGWYRFARRVELFIMDAFVDLFITVCIISNTAFMACDHAHIEPHFANVLNIGSVVRQPTAFSSSSSSLITRSAKYCDKCIGLSVCLSARMS